MKSILEMSSDEFAESILMAFLRTKAMTEDELFEGYKLCLVDFIEAIALQAAADGKIKLSHKDGKLYYQWIESES